MFQYSSSHLIFYFFLYSMIGWLTEVVWSSLKNQSFTNKGFLNLPLRLPYGISAVILLYALPTLQHHLIYQSILSFTVFHIVWSCSEFFVQKICKFSEEDTANIPTLTLASQILFELIASLCLTAVLLIIHPFLHGLIQMIPSLLISILDAVTAMLVIIDFLSVIYLVLTRKQNKGALQRKTETQHLAYKLRQSICQRLEKSYPDIFHSKSEKEYIFAKGLCLDKLIWIFLISSFLGAVIEMIYCRIAGDIWMNRSSLLYGSFSVVWGIGAIILTVCLKSFANKSPLLIFFAGFLIGGAYEYLCSLFTELVFGSVFWDYSHMSYNIGGRTNVLYCFFWGLLGLVWIKMIYPKMETTIEKFPPLQSKIITWMLAVVMLLNGLLTCGAMIRYKERQVSTESITKADAFFDYHYDDDYMEHRWPNMKLTEHK